VPPAAGYLLTDRLWLMLLWGGLISIASSVLGYAAAVVLDASISGMMATVAGGFLILAFLAGPRYGLLAQELRRRRSRFNNAERMLLVHLYQHEGQPGSQEERRVSALASHLRWRPREIDRLLQHSLEHNLVTRGPSDTLLLTPKGRLLAQEVLEPWRG
jgi:manganese/zinc/iron transport system permease protein